MSRAVQEEVNFVETLEHRRFTEFCDACRRYGYIGLCYGSPGVGKTLSAKHYTRWRNFKNVVSWRQLSDTALKSFEGHSTLFYCPSVTNTPRQIVSEISVARDNLRRLAIEPLRRDEERELEEIRTAERVGAYGWQSRVAGADSVYGRVAKAYAAREKAILDPTKLIVVDEADRLQMASLEQLRAIFDESDLGLILIGMPGLEKRLARYPQFYSRIGFVHEFRPLSQSEMRQLLLQRWMPPDLELLKVAKIDPDAIATIIRVTNGNFRLLHRLLTQIERILEINSRIVLTKGVVEAARETLVIGQV
jgi:DNA transposition AAA+ family ATPase